MADEEIQTPQDGTVSEPAALKKTSRAKNATAEKARVGAPKPSKPRTRGLSDQEKMEKIGKIEAQIASGQR